MHAPTQRKRLGRVKEAAAALGGVGVATVWRWARTNPAFPQPLRIGPNTTMFDLDELEAWVLAKREAANDPSKVGRKAGRNA